MSFFYSGDSRFRGNDRKASMAKNKNMNKSYVKYLAAIAGVIATTAIVAAATYAYQGEGGDFQGRNFDPERHEAMIAAIDSQDYEAWAELMAKHPMGEKILEKVTADNFSAFAEARQLMKEGKFEEAKELREELGFPLGLGVGKGMRRGMHKPLLDANGDGVCDFHEQVPQPIAE